MSRTTVQCLCGEKLVIDSTGEWRIECPKCEMTHSRYYDIKRDAYFMISFKKS